MTTLTETPMTELSPGAKEILDAVRFEVDAIDGNAEWIAAAVLRAVVRKCEYCDDFGNSFIDPKDLLAIVNELNIHSGW
jgi:hypothetical protein